MTIASMLVPPRTVRVHVEMDPDHRTAFASVREPLNETIYASGSLRFIHHWLKRRGYSYVEGSRALWCSRADDARRQRPG